MSQQLQTAWRKLTTVWQEARGRWTDQTAADFEKHHWQPLEQQTLQTLREQSKLDEILAQAERNTK